MNAIAQIVAQDQIAKDIAAADKAAPKAKRVSKGKAATVTPAKDEKAAPVVIAKDANVEAPKAKERTVRPAQEKAATQKSAVAKAAPVLAVKFRILDGARPQAGRALFAHTQAVIELLKLATNAVPRSALTAIIGTTAVAHHIKGGRFELTNDGIKLSVFGINFFAGRTMKAEYDPQDVKDFSEVLTTGATNRVCKNKTNIAPMKAD